MNAIPMLILVILVIIFLGSTLRRPAQQIRPFRRAARGPIGTLPATGWVGVAGQATGEELRSPLTDTPCLLWQVFVERHRYRGRWATIFESKSTQPLILDDGTGRVQVLPAAAELWLSGALQQTRSLMRPLDLELEARLEQLDPQIRDLGGGFGRQLRVSERYILAGEQLSALGYVERHDDQPVLQAFLDRPLFLTDQDLAKVLKDLYRQVILVIGVIVLIVLSFSCCLLLQVLEPG